MRILFLSRWFPYPADNGAKIRVFYLLKGLASRHQVDLISFHEEPVGEGQIAEMQNLCTGVTTLPYKPFAPTGLKAILGFFATKPRSVIDTFDPEMMAEVRRAVSRHSYDLIIASQIDMAPYALEIPGCRKVLEELEISKAYDAFTSQKSLIARMRAGLTWYKLKAYVKHLLQQFDGCTVVSSLEREIVKLACDDCGQIYVVPNGVDFVYYRDYEREAREPDSLIYSGALTYSVNLKAVEYFLSEIFPLILRSRPAARFYITGRTDGVAIDRLPNLDNVVFTGYVADIRTILSRCVVSVVPLLSGGGTRLKILESMAIGTPVVSTTKGAEGLELRPGQEILIADSPAQFADAVLGLMANAEMRAAIAAKAGNVAAAIYDWRYIVQELLDRIDEWVPAQG